MADGSKSEMTHAGPASGLATGLLSAASGALLVAAYLLVIKNSVIDNGGRLQWWHLAPVLLFGAPYAVMALLAFRGSYASYQFAQSQALLGLIAGIPLSLLALLGGALSMGDRDPVNAMFAIWTFTALQVALLLVTRRAKRALASTVPAEGGSVVAGFAPFAWACVAFLGTSAASSIGAEVTRGVRRTPATPRPW